MRIPKPWSRLIALTLLVCIAAVAPACSDEAAQSAKPPTEQSASPSKPDSAEAAKTLKGSEPSPADFKPYAGAPPSAMQIIADLRQHNPQQQHPRLFATADTFIRLQEGVKSDPLLRKWYGDLRKAADKTLTKPVGAYETPDGRRMLSARDARPVIEQNAMMFRLSGDDKYAKRAIEEMMALAAFPDWNDKKEFLNTAEITAGMGIGYDWLYERLTQEQRDTIRQAMVDKGLQKALDAHNNKAWWSVRTDPVNNWSAVCNGGIIVGALAIGDEEPVQALAGDIIARSLQSVQNIILSHWEPDGGWSEGPGYWRYMMEYTVSYMAALQSSLGTTYGHAETPGLHKTAYFPIYTTGPQGTFNFADSDSGKMKIPELFWLAKATNDPMLAERRIAMMEDAKQNGGVYDLLWYDPQFREAGATLPADQYYRDAEVVTMRSKWDDPAAAFVGFKAGTAIASHSHSDTGEFVFHADGIQWAIDPGKEDYNLKGYFEYDKERYTYYRLKPEGHNTLVINPDKQFQQIPTAMSRIAAYDSKPQGAYAIADMQPAYARNADTAKRGVMFADRKRLIVEDEIENKAPSTVWWFMHTKASVQIAEDGRSALLSQNGKRLSVRMVFPPGDEPAGAVFQVMDAKPLPESDNPKGQTPNNGIRKLAVKLDGVTAMRMAVELTPLAAGESVPAEPGRYVPLAEWSLR
ncbi:heparinase II/III family protein [Paenibacillus doosanensis]|uniref:heparinase II/III domain-containing protein n=1 Tax=Paenibacillus doosanensis TaxID=1229154 RepID=UPI00217F5591|nr:heparinase II/III family protein [Paenibacillus doosanensis]MCS7464144.1 heparinase II/III family protein [Paenibacillus doosanensis]